jgi:glycerol-3-phosphate cytidylyltransferase
MNSRPKVLTIGSFDLLHYGHVDFLKSCATLGNLIVGVNTDDFITKFKPSPTLSLAERQYAVEQLGYTTYPNDGAGKELIEHIKPDILVVGSDWARKDYYKQIDVTQDWLDEHKIIMAYVPYVQWRPISSSEIKRRVRNA